MKMAISCSESGKYNFCDFVNGNAPTAEWPKAKRGGPALTQQ
jgi:hypothetical protein